MCTSRLEGFIQEMACLCLLIASLIIVGSTQAASADQISCDFEEDWCGYQVTTTDGDDKWVRTSWNTAHQNGLGETGEVPPVDSTHHTSDGNYLVFQHKKKTGPVRGASIISAAEQVNRSLCISFHYQNYKRSNTYAITLMLNVLYDDDGRAELIWASSTSYGYRWMTAEVEYTVPAGTRDSTSFKVEFTTHSMANTEGIAALDDITFSPGECSKIGDCTFNPDSFTTPGRKYCSWEPIIQGPFNMIWGIGNLENGPSGTGEFIYFRGGRGSGNLLKSRALLTSEPMVYGISKCMTFQYYMNATGAAEIRIHQVQAVDQDTVLWAVDGFVPEGMPSGDTFGWRLARVPLQSLDHRNFTVMIEGRIKREISEMYIVAIDNIQFLQDPCTLAPPIGAPFPGGEVSEEHGASVCNFEDDQLNNDCGYTVEEAAPAQFHFRTGNTFDEYYNMHAPMFDRTTLEEYGRYLYFAPIKASQGTYARHISPEYKRDNPDDPRCLNFWYYFRSGLEEGELNVYARFNGAVQLLWSSSDVDWSKSTYSGEWSLATATILPEGSFQILLEAMIMKNDGYLSAAFDDITVQMTECKVIDCDFEEGFCSWHNHFNASETAELKWEFTNEYVRPEFHSLDVSHGRFIFVSIENTTPAGHQAKLEHYETMKSNQHVCLQFDYFITTVNTGSLTVYWFEKDGEVANYVKIWSTERTDRFGQWESGQALIVSNKPWSVMLVATARPTNSSITAEKHVIALDNIRHRVVTDTATCPSLPVNTLITTPAPPTTTARPTTTADPTLPQSNNSIVYECTFDDNLCGFEIDPASTIQWQRIAEEWTVPNRPEALRDNRFLYANILSESPVFRSGRITSPVIDVNSSVNQFFCIRFWMYLDIWSGGKLMVYLYDPLMDNILLETFTGSSPWTSKSVSIQRNHMFQVGFVVQNTVDLHRYEGIAIDEFLVEAGKCSANESSPTSELCDFEEGPCKFSVSGIRDDFKWRITTGNDTHDPTDSFLMTVKPETDHTYSTSGGHYAFAYLGANTDTWSSIENQETDMTYSNITSLSGDQCVSVFYRLLKGNVREGPTLGIRMKSDSIQRTLWSTNIAHGRKWVALKTTIISRGLDAVFDLDITFAASGAKGSKGAVAIDDFAITPGACEHHGDCQFNTGSGGMCSWSHLTESASYNHTTMQWTNGHPPGGPQTDSAYIYIEGGRPTGHLPGSRAVLFSEDMSWPAEQALCMTFKFFSNASGAAVVRVHQVVDPTGWNPLWENFGRQAVNTSQGESVWHHAQVPLEKPKTGDEFLITIEGYVRREVDAAYFIAVDDVVFLNQACRLAPSDSIAIPTVEPSWEDTANVCTFDNGDMCEWTHESSRPQAYTWQILSGRDRDQDPHVPAFDHSTLENLGKFIYFNSSMAPPSGTKILKAFTRQKPNEPACLRFWMYMQGENPGEAYITVEGQGFPETEIAAYTGPETDRWLQYTAAIPESLTQYIIRIEGYLSSSGNGGIAIDDIAVSPGVCKQVDCNFEHGMCSWENYYDSLGNMEYAFVYGTSTILPSKDDSVDRGVFIYVPVPSAMSPSPTYLRHDGLVRGSTEGSFCVHFDYLITAENVGRLALWHYWLTDEEYYDYATVWSSRGEPNYGSWQRGQVYLDHKSLWTLMFEAMMDGPSADLSSRLHGIAIDNIEHELVTSAGLCPTLPRPNTTSTTYATTTPGTITPRPTSSTGNTILQSCNFDQDACGWTVLANDSAIIWHRAHQDYGVGDNAWFVPYRTETPRNDWFLFADTSSTPIGNKMGAITTPVTPATPNTADYCLRFWMYANTKENTEINVVRRDFPESRAVLLKRWRGEVRPGWTAEHIPFTAQSAFQIMFRAITLKGVTLFGAVAVDEYVLEAGKCFNDLYEQD